MEQLSSFPLQLGYALYFSLGWQRLTSSKKFPASVVETQENRQIVSKDPVNAASAGGLLNGSGKPLTPFNFPWETGVLQR